MSQIHIYSGKIYSDTGVGSVLRAIKNYFDQSINSSSFVVSLDVGSKSDASIKTHHINFRKFNQNIKVKIRKYAYKKTSTSLLFSSFILLMHLINGIKVSKMIHSDSVVICHDIWALMALSILKVRLKSVYFVMHNNGSLIEAFETGYPSLKDTFLASWINNRAFSAFDKLNGLIFLSFSSLDKFKADAFELRVKSFVIPNGIERFNGVVKYASGEKINVHVTGTVCDRKRQYLVIELCRRKLVSSKIIFHIWGDGPDLNRLKKMSVDLSIDCIIFHGSTSSPFNFYNLGDVFFLPSKNEGLPIAVLEALRSGCINLLTDTGANGEIVQKSSGFLMKNTTDEDILSEAAECFSVIINMTEEERMYLAKKSIDLFNSNYTVESMMEKYNSLL